LPISWFRPLQLAALLAACDAVAIVAIPLTGSLLRDSEESLQRNLCFWTLLAGITILLIASHGGYRLRRRDDLRRQIPLAINGFLATCLSMLAMAALLGHPHILVRHWTVAEVFLAPLLLAGTRIVLHGVSAAAEQPARGALVIGFDECPPGLGRALAAQHVATRIAGILYLGPRPPSATEPGPPVLRGIEAVGPALREHAIHDIVFIMRPELDTLATQRRDLLFELLAYPARIWFAVDLARHLPAIIGGHADGCRILPVVTDDLVSSRNLTKRLLDLGLGLLALALASPLILLVAAAVRLGSPGPVIFRQSRIGAHGRPFTVLKFRTMVNDPQAGFAQARARDPRVTRIGGFLRRTSLDELLQLINVIRGDMSLVGPRPLAAEMLIEGTSLETAVRLYRLRYRVKPGITGLAQVRGQRGETAALVTLEQRLASDLEYIQSWSIWLDMLILLRTVPVVLRQTNAC